MPACDTNTLTQQAQCLNCVLPPGMQTPILISLLARIAGVSDDPQFLIEQSKCYQNCIPDGMKMPVLIYLACLWLYGPPFFGAGEVDPFFGTSEYRALTPLRVGPGPTLIRWTVPDLSGEFVVFLQHLNTDFFSWTVWASTVDDITAARPAYISSNVLNTQIPGAARFGIYVPPCNFLWVASWGGPPPVQPSPPTTPGIPVPANFTGNAFIRLPGPTIHFS